MKIALLGLRLSVGPRLIVDTLGAALVRLGHDVVFVGEPHTPPMPIRAVGVSDGASYITMLRQSFSRAYYRSVIRALREERPDVCYFISLHPANGLLCRMIRSGVRTPSGRPPMVAVHLHDPVPHPGPAFALIFGAQQLMARAADRVVVFGRSLADQVARHYGITRERIVVSTHGASRPPRREPPNGSAYRYFSFLGRIHRYKGLDLFLAAARHFLAVRPEVRYYVGGAGSLAPYRDQLAELGPGVEVENRELTDQETDRIMQTSWAVVLPYASGTQSGVIPVAYWNACPVITTGVGALAEVVCDGETGFLVTQRDPAAFGEKMAVLEGNSELRQRMGRAAFAFYDRILRWDRIADELLVQLAP